MTAHWSVCGQSENDRIPERSLFHTGQNNYTCSAASHNNALSACILDGTLQLGDRSVGLGLVGTDIHDNLVELQGKARVGLEVLFTVLHECVVHTHLAIPEGRLHLVRA